MNSVNPDVEVVDLGNSYPAILSVEITTNCNLRCTMCALSGTGTRSSQSPGDIYDVVWQRVLQVAPKVGYININGWGENFSNPRFLDFLRDLDDLGVPVCFTTNGTFITPDIAARLGELRNIDRITVSVDSPDPETFKEIRGIRLDTVLQGLRSLVDNYPRLEDVIVCSVVMDRNLSGLRAFPALLASIGLRNYVLLGMVANGGAIAEDGVSIEAAAAAIDDIRAICSSRGMNFLVHPYLENRVSGRRSSLPTHATEMLNRYSGRSPVPTRQCSSPWDHLFVNRNGLVLPCCNCSPWEQAGGASDGILGDLRQNSFEEVWASDRVRRFQNRLRRGDLPEVCRACHVTSTGPHFFDVFSARLEPAACRSREGSVAVAFRNTGAATWTPETKLRIGTARPRDRVSTYRHPTWISSNRATTLLEGSVAPTEVGHFEFPIAAPPRLPGRAAAVERFQLVAEGVCWLPNTEFELRPATDSFSASH
jgi:radical SAM protein with 4Fe4S-binding SPASM domain